MELGAPLGKIPDVTDANREFWQSGAQGQLRLQRCASCSALRHPVAPACPTCLSFDATWESVSGEGTVFATATYRHAFSPDVKDALPYTLAIVQLAEGPRMITNIVGQDGEGLPVGTPVTVVFEKIAEGIWRPQFRAAEVHA